MIEKEGGREAAEGGAGGSLRAGDAKEMRAVVLSAFGGLNKLRVSKKAMPEPQEGELKIRVKAWSSIAPRPLLPPGGGGGGAGGCGFPAGPGGVRAPACARAGGRALRPGIPALGACRASPAAPGSCADFPHLWLPRGGAPLPAAAAAPSLPRRRRDPRVSAELRAAPVRGGQRGLCALGSGCEGKKIVSGISRYQLGEMGGGESLANCVRGLGFFEKCGCQLVRVAQHLSLPLLTLAVVFLLGITYLSQHPFSSELLWQRGQSSG